MKIILASGSARRQELLEKAGYDFRVAVSDVDESCFFRKYKNPKKAVQELALAKAEDVQKQIGKNQLIIGADTIVVFKHKTMGKPKNKKEAIKMLKKLSGQKHEIITGMAVLRQNRVKTFYEITEVWFRKLSLKDIDEYLDTGIYMDRAGAYGIQDRKCNFVVKYKGEYDNILGLPIKKLKQVLGKWEEC